MFRSVECIGVDLSSTCLNNNNHNNSTNVGMQINGKKIIRFNWWIDCVMISLRFFNLWRKWCGKRTSNVVKNWKLDFNRCLLLYEFLWSSSSCNLNAYAFGCKQMRLISISQSFFRATKAKANTSSWGKRTFSACVITYYLNTRLTNDAKSIRFRLFNLINS